MSHGQLTLHILNCPLTISTFIPLFLEYAHSKALVKHGMDIILKSTKLVNPSLDP